MGEFFKGWRRKMGAMTLVVACAFLGGWGISLGGHHGMHRLAYPIKEKNVEFAIALGEDSLWLGKYRTDVGGMNSLFRIGIPYWFAITPLTVLSAYLLLSKARA